ncbi:hypothetical protein AB0K60_37095 [Thermopolyspora sp. NPDC052614]|uniref:hypothetical protein n=1 Tax=Thermopolyspora sp. NPDC052614 TaxID=3155682 RepID=UPI003431E459
MPVIRPQAGSRVLCYRIPDGWPVLRVTGSDGRPFIVAVDGLGAADALAFATRLARGVALWTREVRECYAEGESGWARRAAAAGAAVPNLLRAELVEPHDPPWRAPTVEHTPPKSAAEWAAELSSSPWSASHAAAERHGWEVTG